MTLLFIQLFANFFFIGLLTIGGGYAMIPLVQEVVVQKHNWITVEQFEYMIGLAECTPGPIALNMATFVGATQGGFFGGVCATIGVVLPSFVIICLVAALFEKISENIYIKSSLRGASFIAIGLIGSIAVTMFIGTISNANFKDFQINWQGIKVLGISLVLYITLWLIRKKKPGPLPTIGMSAIVGLLVGFLWK